MNQNRISQLLLLSILFLVGQTGIAQESLATNPPTSPRNQKPIAGKLVIVGGGGTPDKVVEMVIDMAGAGGSILVVPHASSRERAGAELVTFFQNRGAEAVQSLDLKNLENGIAQVEKASVIWFGGGSQNRLMSALPASIQARIRERHAGGCVIGGTSAGAAVMSKLMITGESDLESISADATKLAHGLGLTDMIVDQHFHRRRRFNRLLGAVLDQPNLIGVGIDERTAIIVSGSEFKVVGKGSVLVLNATKADVSQPTAGANHSATGVSLSLLVEGQVYELTN